MAIIRTFGCIGAMALVLLSGCASPVTSPAGLAQLAYDGVQLDLALAAKKDPSLAAQLTKLENVIGPEIAPLSTAVAPTSASAALSDLKKFADALPPTVVSAEHLAEIDAAISAAQLLNYSAPVTAAAVVPPAAAAPPPAPAVNLGSTLTTPATAASEELVP